jgi:NADH-quinone oxidoreductase subunit N
MMNLLATPPAAPDVNFQMLSPELILSVAGIVVMLVDAFTRRRSQRWVTGALSLAGIIASAFATVSLWNGGDQGVTAGQPYGGMIALDTMRLSFTLVFLIVAALTVLVSMIWVEWEGLPAGEFHTLLLFATVGMMLMASGNDLVMIFLGLEILSIATYVMAGFRRSDVRSNESSLKYFILGSFSSAFLLFGIALIYGATAKDTGAAAGHAIMPGTTNISVIAERIADPGLLYPSLLFAGAGLLMIGFGFKVASAPFHVWTPDVYEGAPTPVTAFMAAGPKAAGFSAFMRVFLVAFPVAAAAANVRSTGAHLHDAWVSALWVLAVLTMTVGNVVALVQTNVKRLLAYSSIAHAGYAMVGFVAAGAAQTAGGTQSDAQTRDAIAAVVFYLLSYAVMNLGAFAVVTLVARSGDRRTDIEDYRGMGFQSPALSLTLSLFLLSLLGVPLTAGFMGKVVVFSEALKQQFYWLVVIGVLNTAVSVYYYLRLVVVMFFRERTTEWHAPRIPASVALVLVLTVAGVLYLGLFPGGVINAFRASQPSAVSKLR